MRSVTVTTDELLLRRLGHHVTQCSGLESATRTRQKKPESCYKDPERGDKHKMNTISSGDGRMIDAKQTPAVLIRTLGAFRVIRDGTPVSGTVWQSKKARDLLKILIARRAATTREQLVELLWPEVDPAKAGNRLSMLLQTVRNVLQRHAYVGPLASDGSVVWLDRMQVRVDVEEFLTDAINALAAGRGDVAAPDAAARLTAALAAYTGDFLEDDAHADWATSLAEEARAIHIALLRTLAARLQRTGDIDGAIQYLLRLLRQDPFDEQAHLDLVDMQLDVGHLSEARRQYDVYVQRMKEIEVHPHPLL
ncbi:MAG: BTAD domain-containing putative transcriptional regulator [Pseudonocardiaceae bacterium]